MTDAEIREWLADTEGKKQMMIAFPVDQIRPLLKELLEHRSLKLTSCWRVWCPDPSPQGWRAVAAFMRKEDALQYRQFYRINGALVLPHNEEPALTAR